MIIKKIASPIRDLGAIVWRGVKETIPNAIIGLSVGAAIIAACFLLVVFVILLYAYPLQTGAAIFIYHLLTTKHTRK